MYAFPRKPFFYEKNNFKNKKGGKVKMKIEKKSQEALPWAEFRFTVIGRLLSVPPSKGELQDELRKLAKITWKHPTTGERKKFGFSTIEAWYY